MSGSWPGRPLISHRWALVGGCIGHAWHRRRSVRWAAYGTAAGSESSSGCWVRYVRYAVTSNFKFLSLFLIQLLFLFVAAAWARPALNRLYLASHSKTVAQWPPIHPAQTNQVPKTFPDSARCPQHNPQPGINAHHITSALAFAAPSAPSHLPLRQRAGTPPTRSQGLRHAYMRVVGEQEQEHSASQLASLRSRAYAGL
ncbi:hypothetical protein BGZ61DRAFT_437145 [Ilyonectria robusta]|uniref:uncharacterized protein n=1 Tax=Ilyonectria robusta TaxID=1079257 RepID=UPI001E8D4AB6|nr:uncharacterized protein BGZ61DRAFT_437145 [Ilyonectria robusta]KAH8736844.1 hypothetical protein BGZ61DRAFT_437145 [Ilyonectria robusta]